MIEWPEEVSGDSVARACEAARMGVNTAIVLGGRRLREAVEANLMELAAEAVFDARYGVPAWVFPGGGELILVTNLSEAKNTYHRRHPSERLGPEVVYPKSGRV